MTKEIVIFEIYMPILAFSLVKTPPSEIVAAVFCILKFIIF